MIISASRRTDIPAFYSDWFMNRIREGFFIRINPFNPKQKKLISLLLKDIDIIVFWSKNPAPILKHLKELDNRGYQYYFQFTLNAYPFTFEPKVPNWKRNIETFQQISNKLGKEKVIWRYDPIVLSNRTPVSYHVENFGHLAEKLKNHTTKCVFSFLDMYGKVEKRLKQLEQKHNIITRDICSLENKDELYSLMEEFKIIATKSQLKLTSCAEGVNLSYFGIEPNSCIDGPLINRILGEEKQFKKDKNQRKECLCAESIDVGIYNTCLHKCTYCYANYSKVSIDKNFKKHNRCGRIMVGDAEPKDIELADFKKHKKELQMTLF